MSDARETAICIGNYYAPNFEKVGGAYCFWSVRGCVVCAWVTLFSSPVQSTGRAIVLTLASALALALTLALPLPFPSRHF